MKRLVGCGAAIAFAASIAMAAYAQGEAKMSAVPQTPEWQKLKTLVGQWEGFMEQDGKQLPTTVEVRMTGDESAIMHVMSKDTPYEMVTMIHPDGKRLLATHYCGAHNQPRMALVASKAPNEVKFDFVDGTNIAPGDLHMKSVVFVFTDGDHHEERWTDSQGAKAASVFKFTRKK
ncbi:MAG: hypothetical protein ACM3NQ_23760 [Bacteroidales bacterium]